MSATNSTVRLHFDANNCTVKCFICIDPKTYNEIFPLETNIMQISRLIHVVKGNDQSSQHETVPVLSCIVLSHIWQFCGLEVGILGNQSPKYVLVKGLQTGPFKSSWLPNSNTSDSRFFVIVGFTFSQKLKNKKIKTFLFEKYKSRPI